MEISIEVDQPLPSDTMPSVNVNPLTPERTQDLAAEASNKEKNKSEESVELKPIAQTGLEVEEVTKLQKNESTDKIIPEPTVQVSATSDKINEVLEFGVVDGILIIATGSSWMQIRDGLNDKVLMTRLMQLGDRYEVPDQEGLHLLTGNAGAIEVYVDGKKVPSIGGAGVVRRKVVLDNDRLRSGTAVEK